MDTNNKHNELIKRVEDLELQLAEAQDTIDAIRTGEVDAFIVNNGNGHEIYTLKSADFPYRIFIEKMAEGAVTLNREGLVLYSNSSFANMLNINIADILGIHFESFFPIEFNSLIKKLISKAWMNECKAEVSLQNSDNKTIPVLLSMSSLEKTEEQTLSIIVTDLSFQKEAQEQKMAMERKDEFISIASHELRTPVTSIKGYVQLLRFNFLQQGNNEAADLLSKADAQINKLTTLINDLLDVKKIETGQLQFHETAFDFNLLVKEIIEETGRIIKNHSIELQLPPACIINGDRNKIGQVISNFIDNAAKYSPANTTIKVSAAIKGNKVKLIVEDEGMGIPKDQQIKIFERFFRVKGVKENTYAGLGLGLYICSEIIKRHKGAIGLESEEGKGSAFYFELPVTTNN